MPQPVLEPGEPGVLGPRPLAEGAAQGRPELLLVAHQVDPAVPGLVQLARGQRRVGRTGQPFLDRALVQVPSRRIGGVGERDVEQADVDIAPGARRPRPGQPRQHRIGQRQPGHLVDDGQAEPGRRPARFAGQGKIARFRLHQVIEARPVGARTGPPIGGEVGADDLRVVGLEVIVGKAELPRHVAAQVRRHRVRRPDQVVEHRLALGAGEVQGQALFVAVVRMIELGILGREEVRPHVARHVAAVVGVLDLDHLGPLVAQEHGAERPGPVLLDGENAHSFQGQHQTGLRSTSWRAMTMRCISLVPSPMASRGASR